MVKAEQSYQRLYVALNRVVVSAQVSHEAQARHCDVVVMRLAVGMGRGGRREHHLSFLSIKDEVFYLDSSTIIT